MIYELTDSIPQPPHGNTKYPFSDMAVDQSFFVPGPNPPIRNSASNFSKKSGMKFACRVVTEDGVRGIRVWRTA